VRFLVRSPLASKDSQLGGRGGTGCGHTFVPNAFVSIGSDNSITGDTKHLEKGGPGFHTPGIDTVLGG